MLFDIQLHESDKNRLKKEDFEEPYEVLEKEHEKNTKIFEKHPRAYPIATSAKHPKTTKRFEKTIFRRGNDFQ